ncbi:hypothetical protein K1T71_011617 [Dendrolimus kikuchii]|uniref:Uncharacterized protein n=1 Tax=Dendrolimus kikuchii TaxID=765133 RepID=A0ACC1CLL5_9NEOP|nr:hypothetical protein K1T71_011617 [Dendrolimus kikuchii]
MRTFVGLLIVIGANRSGRQNLKDFWDNSVGTGFELVYLTMSINRFRFLIRSIRFDDIRDRPQRQETDKLAAIRGFIETMRHHCLEYYIPSECLTLDEQLVAFRGRCRFIMYLPNKPAKFGIKIFMVADTKYPYIYNFEVYCGDQPEGPFHVSNKVADVTNRLLEPLIHMGRNVTMDNWFTSYPENSKKWAKERHVLSLCNRRIHEEYGWYRPLSKFVLNWPQVKKILVSHVLVLV